MLKLKQGVTPRNLYIAAALANVGKDYPFDITITAGTDGKHMVGSKHYTGDALDVRSSVFPNPETLADFLSRVRLRLGPGYDIVTEADHIHIEYDPH